jgi:hypothetical protein
LSSFYIIMTVNYIKHTRSAHERLCNQPEARPHHVALYWVLFFAWNAARFPYELALDRREMMATAHIGNRGTFLASLRDLDAWGLLAYLPSHGGGSTVRLKQLGDVELKVGQPSPASYTKSGPTKQRRVVSEVDQPLAPKVVHEAVRVVPESDQHSLLCKTILSKRSVNGYAAAKKKIEVLEAEGESEVQVWDNPARIEDEQVADFVDEEDSSFPANQIAPKGKAVKQPQVEACSVAPPLRSARFTSLPDLPFSQSPIAELGAFTQAFKGTDYELADLPYYHQRVATWRDKKTGLPPTRKDWVASATNFMLNDISENRLKLASSVQFHQPSAGGSNAMGSGIPATGYRSKRWD